MIHGSSEEVTDPHELQNLLDDFGPMRPELNVYGRDMKVYAVSWQLERWRKSPVRAHRLTPTAGEKHE